MSSKTPANTAVEELAATRKALRSELDGIDWRSTDSPLARYLRQSLQLANVQLAAAAVRRDFPAAASFVLADGEDGQGQGGYEIFKVLGNDGSTLRSVSIWTGSDWARTPVAGGKSPGLSDLAWSISLTDDTWAEGIAIVQNGSLNGKTATIDIDAALAKAAPKRPGSKKKMITHLKATQDALDMMREQTRQAENAYRLASIRLAAATILERFPGAKTLELAPDGATGKMQIHSISGTEGTLFTPGWDGTGIADGRGADGTPSLKELISDAGRDFPGEDTDAALRHRGHITVDLLAARGPA